MQRESYEQPRVEDRTSVAEPLNTVAISDGLLRTPAWRSRAAGDQPTAEAYEAPRVDEHTPVSAPLNTVTNSVPLEITPAWRTKGDDH